MDARFKRVEWGRGNPRQRTSEANWRKPLMWDQEAQRAGERRKVFCASLADVFDPEVPEQWRSDVFAVIQQTSNLDWLLLTKRPALGIEHLGKWQTINPEAARSIWFGISAEDQQRFDEFPPGGCRSGTPGKRSGGEADAQILRPVASAAMPVA